jgi:methionine-rich copper-binding protein CopC
MAVSHSLFTCGLLALISAAPACANTALISATPADGSAGPAPASISLTFSDKVTASGSGIALAMPGMKMPPLTADLSADGKTLSAVPPDSWNKTGWMKGVYQIHWHAAGNSGAPAQGTITFTVK